MFSGSKSSAVCREKPLLIIPGKVRVKRSWCDGSWNFYEKFGNGTLKVITVEGGRECKYSWQLCNVKNIPIRVPSGKTYQLCFVQKGTNSSQCVDIQVEDSSWIRFIHSFVRKHSDPKFTGSSSSSVTRLAVGAVKGGSGQNSVITADSSKPEPEQKRQSGIAESIRQKASQKENLGGSHPLLMHNKHAGVQDNNKMMNQDKENLGNRFANLGNTCYMNAILQALFGMEPFAKELLKLHQMLKEFSAQEPNSLLNSLVQLLSCNDEDLKKSLLSSVKSSISSSAQRFSGYAQHDAHEFLGQVLDQLKEEVVSAVENYKSRLDPEKVLENPVQSNFEFTVCHRIECLECGNVIKKEESFYDLALDLPVSKIESGKETSECVPLQGLLRLSFQEECVEYKCELCKGERSAISHKFTRLPRILIVYLKRYSYNALLEYGTKVADEIDIPKHLSLQKLCSRETKFCLHLSSSTKKLKVPRTSAKLTNSACSVPAKRGSGTFPDENPVKKKLFLDEVKFYEDVGGEGKLDNHRILSCDGEKPITVESEDGDLLQKALELSRQENDNNVPSAASGDEDRQIQEAIKQSLMENQARTMTADETDRLFEEETQRALEASMVEHSPNNCTDPEPMDVDADDGQLVTSGDTVFTRPEYGVFDDQMEFSVEIVSESRDYASDFVFYPVDSEWQSDICEHLELPYLRAVSKVSLTKKALDVKQKPRKRKPVAADGNCLFRALSYWITGTTKSHMEVRRKITEFMRKEKERFAKFDAVSVEQFLNKVDDMDVEGTWGTQSELLATAILLQTEIFVYCPRSTKEKDSKEELCWHRFRVLRSYEGAPAKSERCIYLANEHCHYEPVLEIEDNKNSDLFDSVWLKRSALIKDEPEGENTEHTDTTLFRLYSVVSHIGSTTSAGHYVCDVLDFNDDKWKSCDDSHVESTTEDFVRKYRSKSGYIFFYVINSCHC